MRRGTSSRGENKRTFVRTVPSLVPSDGRDRAWGILRNQCGAANVGVAAMTLLLHVGFKIPTLRMRSISAGCSECAEFDASVNSFG